MSWLAQIHSTLYHDKWNIFLCTPPQPAGGVKRMGAPKNRVHMPRTVQRRIVEKSAKGKVAVVVPRNGKPSRVYEYEKYLKMKEQPKKHKPWSYRKRVSAKVDPLGAVEGSVHSTMGREDIYG